MNDESIQDLKQFITATVSQQLAQQTSDIREEMHRRFHEQDEKFLKIDARFDEQDEKLDEILNAVGGSIHEVEQKVADHDKRIVRLERKLA